MMAAARRRAVVLKPIRGVREGHGDGSDMAIRSQLSGPRGILTAMKTLLASRVSQKPPPEGEQGKGEQSTTLHEFQHQVIEGLFKIHLAGFVAFFLIVLSFTLFFFSTPVANGWAALLMVALGSLLLIGFFRALSEFKLYRSRYRQITAQLRVKLRRYSGMLQNQGGSQAPKEGESRLISVLRPKEHSGWDAKACGQCRKTLELLATVCQHCGHEQETFFLN